MRSLQTMTEAELGAQNRAVQEEVQKRKQEEKGKGKPSGKGKGRQ